MPESNPAAAQPGSGRPARAPDSGVSTWFWRIMAFLMLCALALVGWIAWNLTPHSVVTDAALIAHHRSARGLVSPARSPSAPAPVLEPAQSAPEATTGPAAQQPAGETQTTVPGPEMLKLETRINTPIPERAGNATPAGKGAKAKAGG